MEFFTEWITKAVEQAVLSLTHNWPFLLVSVVIAVLLKRFVNAGRISAFLRSHNRAGVFAATAAAVATPLCSCGTTAVILGMMASTMPWAPIVAFMVSSPLTSPEGLVYSAGLFGWPFAIAFYLASIVLGLAGGWTAGWLESRGWLVNQTRFAPPIPDACTCSAAEGRQPAAARALRLEPSALAFAGTTAGCGCGQTAAVQSSTGCGCNQEETLQIGSQSFLMRFWAGFPAFLKDLYGTGRQLLVMFLGFAFIGYLLNGLIPAGVVAAVFGSGNIYSVPLAATLGLPLYINGEASLPLVRTMLDSGMSQGVALAFLIAGAGTSIGAISGALTIARWRIVALVVGVLWVGAIGCGYAFDLLLAVKIF